MDRTQHQKKKILKIPHIIVKQLPKKETYSYFNTEMKPMILVKVLPILLI